MRIILYALTLFCSFFYCCKSVKSNIHKDNCKAVKISKDEIEYEQGEITVLNAVVKDKKIMIDFTANKYNSISNIELHWDGKMAKSLPPIAYLVLAIDKGNNPLHKLKKCFDLTPMKESAPNTSIKIQIKGYSETLLLK